MARPAPYQLKEDDQGRVWVGAQRIPRSAVIAIVGVLVVVAIAAAWRSVDGDTARRRTHLPAAVVCILAAGRLAGQQRRQQRSGALFDGARAQVTVRDGGRERVLPFAEVRGLRLRAIGRGFQFVVQLVLASGEDVDLLTTGVQEDAKGLAAGLSSRFGFPPIVD